MKFGVFDHMDDSGTPLSQQFENRMKLAEAYDRFGFHAYHLAEHHTPAVHSLAPSQNVFLAAVSQRTSAGQGRNGSGTWITISGWSQYVKACRCGPVRYRRGFTVTV